MVESISVLPKGEHEGGVSPNSKTQSSGRKKATPGEASRIVSPGKENVKKRYVILNHDPETEAMILQAIKVLEVKKWKR